MAAHQLSQLSSLRPARCQTLWAGRKQRPTRSTALRAVATERLALHVGETTVQLPFPRERAADLNAALLTLLKTFSEKQKAERPRRWESMEFKLRAGGPAPDAAGAGAAGGQGGLEYFEVFCNPNAYSSAFDAKVLITIQAANGLSVTTEGRLSNFKADLDAYLAS